MEIYKFLNKKFGLKSLKEKRLKISNIMELNDPFELLGVHLGDREFRAEMKRRKENIAKKEGMICFSGSWRSPLLWGHYADSHKGLCLGFEIPDEDFVKKVQYAKERLNYQDFLGAGEKRLLCTKFTRWKYENEYRLFCRFNGVEEEHEDYFYNFSDDLKLTKVIVGINCDVSRYELDSELGEDVDKIERFKARTAFRTFRVVRNMNEKLWE